MIDQYWPPGAIINQQIMDLINQSNFDIFPVRLGLLDYAPSFQLLAGWLVVTISKLGRLANWSAWRVAKLGICYIDHVALGSGITRGRMRLKTVGASKTPNWGFAAFSWGSQQWKIAQAAFPSPTPLASFFASWNLALLQAAQPRSNLLQKNCWSWRTLRSLAVLADT